jgi:hypothetical protein
MAWRIAMLSALAVVLLDCSSTSNITGADFASVSQKVGPPKAGQARVIVFREPPFNAIDPGYEVKLDEVLMGHLKGATYVYADRPAGRHQISCGAAMFPGVSQKEVALVSGRTYFFNAKPSARAKALLASQAVGGLVGLAVGTAVTSNDDNPGPLDFVPVDDAAARQVMAEFQFSE